MTTKSEAHINSQHGESNATKTLLMENNDTKRTTEPSLEDETAGAEAYVERLLSAGAREGDSGAEMELPEYYDEQIFARGQAYLSKYRFVYTSGMLSGLVAVLAVPSILRVLMCTRQSSTPETAFRRYVRTILHTNAWYEYSPSSKDSKFWTSLRTVRNAHNRSSRACSKLSAGQISQKDLALTQFGFIGFITLGAPRIQLHDDDFLECTTHMWRVVGYLLGIKDEYNLCATSWAETKRRMELVMARVYTPALTQTSEEFVSMTKALLEGLWPVNTSLTVDSFIFFTKRLACVEGYEYYDFDHPNYSRSVPDSAQRGQEYYKLGWWDRFVVSYGLFLVTYLHQYSIVRWYLNVRVWLNLKLMYYLPYLAIWKFGIKSAYVRIFTKTGGGEEFEFKLKED